MGKEPEGLEKKKKEGFRCQKFKMKLSNLLAIISLYFRDAFCLKNAHYRLRAQHYRYKGNMIIILCKNLMKLLFLNQYT